jgi:hypothetical protein
VTTAMPEPGLTRRRGGYPQIVVGLQVLFEIHDTLSAAHLGR